MIARNWRSCWLVLSPKLPKSSIINIKPTSFISPAVVAVVLIVWMETDSRVVGRRVIKLGVILIGLTPRGSEVDRKVVFRSFSVGVVINMLVLVAAGFKLAK